MDKNTMQTLLGDHLGRYPQMQPQDLVKLLYQNEFGCGHMISDAAAFLDNLRRESRALTASDEDYVDIGGGFWRVPLAKIASGEVSAEALTAACLYTARTTKGSQDAFAQKLHMLENLCRDGTLPCSVDAYLLAYRAAGSPAVHHSDKYRELYKPAYRVVSKGGMELLKVLQAADDCIRSKGRAVLAVDGNCGSGKSLIAECIEQTYGAAVVHMDDFFLQPVQRTLERLREPGGNIDYERFADEVLPGLKSARSFVYRVFDCRTQRFADLHQVALTPLRVVEGSYSLHEKFRDVYDVKLFLSTDPVTQTDRIEARDGAQMLKAFLSRWIPMECTYHKVQEVMQCSDFVMYT